MKAIKGTIAAVIVLGSLLGASPARAGIPVIDAANLVQSIQQVIAWVQQQVQMATQIENQISQIDNQATQIARITGSRNLGQVFNNPLLQQAVPANVTQVMSAVNAQGFGGMTPAAQALRQVTMLYNCMDRPAGPLRTGCQAPLSANFQAQAWQGTALTTVTQRVAEIQSMQQQINATADPMAINQVQAALQAETAQVTNDQNRIALMNQQIASAKAAAQQAQIERNLAMLVPNASSFATNLVFP